MTISEDPRDDREVAVEVVVGSDLLPVGKLAFSFKRSWEHRGERYLNAVADAANVDTDTLLRRVEEGGPVTDILSEGMRLALSSGDESWQNAWARFVARAIADPAKIDPVAFIMDELGMVPPSHLRLFWLLAKRIQTGPASSDRQVIWIAERLDVDPYIVRTILSKLQTKRLIELNQSYEIADLGRLALELAGEIDETLLRSTPWTPPR